MIIHIFLFCPARGSGVIRCYAMPLSSITKIVEISEISNFCALIYRYILIILIILTISEEGVCVPFC